jgi:hypothetical protein
MSTYPESVESVCADFKAALVDPVEKVPEKALTCLLPSDLHSRDIYCLFTWPGLIIEDDGRNAVLHNRLPQDSPAWKCTLGIFVAST